GSAAKLHPGQRFALVDAMPVDESGQNIDLGNVTDLLFKAQEPGYLVGALAGLMEKNKVGSAAHNVLGILGSNHSPAVDAYIAGYIAGAKGVDPGLTWKVTYSDSQDTAFCKQLGITQISAGADILFEVTGRCASGYIDAAYDASAYAIGSDNDEAYLSPAVITSALKRVDRAVAITVQRLQNGQFKSGQQLFTTQDDATGFSSPSSVVPQDVINQVLDIRARIRSGAADAVQEAFMIAWNRRQTLHEHSAFVPWLRTIVLRECLRWRRRRFLQVLGLSDRVIAPATSDPALQVDLGRAVRRLSPAQR